MTAENLSTAYGEVSFLKDTKDGKILLVFPDESTVKINREDASRMNTAPDTLKYTPFPSDAARMIEDMRDLHALEIEYPDEIKTIVRRVFDFFGMKENADNTPKYPPFDWTREGLKRRINRRKY